MTRTNLKEFNKTFDPPNAEWKFNLFKIVCTKCKSDKVEYNGKLETEYGYYGSFDVTSIIVIKCHDCGNAFTIKNLTGGAIDTYE